MPARDPAEYMRQRRAHLKEAEEQAKQSIPVENATPNPVTPENPPEKSRGVPDRNWPVSNYKALPGDGWVAKLSQAQRDWILDRINFPNKIRR